MKRYLLSVYQPDGDPPPTAELKEIGERIAQFRAELEAAGAWVFSAGLHPSSTATVVRAQAGETLITDGPYVEGKEHIGGFTVIEAPDLDAALRWAERASEATTLPIEVRPFIDEAAG